MDFAGPVPKEKIELFFSCRKLKDMDYSSKSDPFCVFFFGDNKGGTWIKIGQTDVQENTLNPDFARSFIVDYFFEKVQNIRVDVFDKDPGKNDYIGSLFTTLGKVAGARNQTYMSELKDQKGNKTGTIIIRGESVASSNDLVCMKLAAKKLDNVEGWFSKSDPFLVFSRARAQSMDKAEKNIEWVKVHETEPISNNLNPVWRPFQIKLQRLCNADKFLPIRIDCFDWEKSGSHRYICGMTTSLAQLMEHEGGKKPIDLINEKKQEKHKKKYKNSGTLLVNQCQLVEKPSFMDYLRSGWTISLSAAIDFTASNGEVSDPRSLHYTGGFATGQLNAYEAAILQVGQIVEEYDHDKKFPVWGFGGIPRFMGSNEVSHCFTLTPDGAQVFGTRGIVDAYRFSIQNSGLYGPTLFTPLLNAMYQQAMQTKGQPVYHILLIITDGAIMDMPTTKGMIVSLSEFPVSIIIVGVGSADFSKMEELDSDGGLLRDNHGRAAKRDIVQFVEFNKLMQSPSALAEEVLKEVPDQVIGFMVQNNIPPKKTQQLLPKGTIPPSMLDGFVPPAELVGAVPPPGPAGPPGYPGHSMTMHAGPPGVPPGGPGPMLSQGTFSHPMAGPSMTLPPGAAYPPGAPDPSAMGYIPPPPGP